MRNAHQEYQINQVETADPRQLVVMLYDGAIRFLEKGAEFLDDFKTYDKANQNLLRAQDIITELMVSLDMDKGGEIAENLLSLYTFMKKKLLEANMKKEKEGVIDVIKLLEDLRSAWKEMDLTSGIPSAPAGSDKEPQKRAGFAAQG